MKLLNKLKIILLIAFFIIVFLNLKSFAVTGVITEITVNMRKEPSTDSKRIMYVTQDYKVEVLEKKEDTIISYLRESKSLKVHSSQKEIDGGKRAVTHYRVVRECEKFSMLKVTLETGRKNQIRAHCAQMGHPIIGDKKYGSFSSPIARVGLHAKVLGFHHPRTQEPLYFETSVPKKFNALFIKEKKKEIEKNKI